MHLTSPVLLVSLVVVSAGSVHAAEATTYKGTIGKIAIIVELVKPAEGAAPYGRYAYLSRGGDIPLHGAIAGSGLSLREEKACTDKICTFSDGPVADAVPFGAEWVLKGRAGDAALEGTWRDPDSGKQLAVKLERKGAREIEETPETPFEALNSHYTNRGVTGDPPMLQPERMPYDVLKMAVAMQQGEEQAFGDGAFRLDADTRVNMDYPVVVSLGTADVAPVNAYLAQQRLQAEREAFACLSSSYLGFGWSGGYFERTDGFDGNWSIQMEHLSPRLIGYQESGSYYCGGAHPSNFGDHRLADVKTGKGLNAEDLLNGWITRDLDGKVVDPAEVADKDGLRRAPSDELVAKIKAERRRFDADTEERCAYDDLIADHLGVYFTQDNLVFTLKGLPHVIFACTDDMLVVPLNEARPLLTEAGARYFAVLD